MDIGIVARDSAVEALDEALAEVAEAAHAESGADGAAEATAPRVAMPGGAASLLASALAGTGLGAPDVHGGTIAAPPTPAGTRADHNAETAAQPFLRPPPASAETPRPMAGEQAMVQPRASGFALPADQLVPVMVSSLQVDPAAAWALHGRGFVAPQALPPRPPAPPPEVEEAPPLPDECAVDDETPRAGDGSAGLKAEVEDATEEDWCEPLCRALREALAAPVPPPSLLAAAEQWRRGRCVVLACPQGRDPAGPAWAFVLWPRGRQARRLELRGARVEARLQWANALPPPPWCHQRVIKEHHPRRGRQLIPMDAVAGAAVPCEVQLGPVLARSLRWAVVCLRVDAVRRFWAALGAQWSVTVVVASRPLAGERPAPVEAPC